MSEIERPSIVAIYEFYGLTLIGPDRGQWRKAQCPLPTHEDNNPSAAINEDGEKWHCHACDQGGDGLDIIREREGLAGFSDCSRFAQSILGEGYSPVRHDGGGGGGLSVKPRGNKGYRNTPQGAPWLRF